MQKLKAGFSFEEDALELSETPPICQHRNRALASRHEAAPQGCGTGALTIPSCMATAWCSSPPAPAAQKLVERRLQVLKHALQLQQAGAGSRGTGSRGAGSCESLKSWSLEQHVSALHSAPSGSPPAPTCCGLRSAASAACTAKLADGCCASLQGEGRSNGVGGRQPAVGACMTLGKSSSRQRQPGQKLLQVRGAG